MAEEKEAQAAEGKGSKKWIILGAAGLVIFATIGVLGAWMAGLFGGGQEAEPPPVPAKLTVNQMVSLPPVVFNLSGGRKMTYARIGVSLGISTPSPEIPLFDQALLGPRVTDELLNSVGGMSPEELLRPETKNALKEQIQAFVNSLIVGDTGKVVEVYFTEFIVQ